MSESTVHDDGRYWAFISYSHKDAAFGRRLHRRLESYALPRRLAGRAAAQGTVPRRLTPIFRDRDEFPAAKDLSAEVQAALKVSRSLIVVCSPTAAASPWVAREIELFHALHPDRPILAAIREGDPHECFPEALRHAGPGGASVEPLAADFRRGHDGWELGQLKLVAGMLGVGLDELVQRNSQRFVRRVTAVTAAALALVLVMAVLTVFAVGARNEAERQRAEAEGLAGYMRTDLREKLRSVGRLDVMSAVNQRALAYYDLQTGNESPDVQAHRAQLLQALGEDDEDRGDHNSAIEKFRAAFNITAALLAADPGAAERVFDHAQSTFFLGLDAYGRGNRAGAKTGFEHYRQLAMRMIALSPQEPRYVRELAYAEADLCSLAMPQEPAAALKWCASALRHMQDAARRLPPSSLVQADLFNRQHWLADAYHLNGDEAQAKAHRLIAERMIEDLIKAEPLNTDFKIDWIALQRNLARGEVRSGEIDQAKARLIRAKALIDQMTIFDPHNAGWAAQQRKVEIDLDKIKSGRPGEK